jgi:TPP-dependent pyruvate/acetoin dehydrogenase alpha subunit
MMKIEQILADDGGATVDVDALGMDEAQLNYLYEAMATTRVVDQQAAEMHAAGEVGFYVASRGLEAASVGAAACLQSGDWLFGSQRDLGMFLLRGGSMRAWFDQVLGNAADKTKGRQLPGYASLAEGAFVSVSGRVGTRLSQAVGCAMAMKADSEESCVMTSFGASGDTATLASALSLAARFRAPVILLCRTVHRAGGGTIGAAATLAEQAQAFGVRSVRVDGGDVLAVNRAVRSARDAAIDSGGATLVELVTAGTVLFDDGRSALAPADDPLARMRDFLEQSGLWDAARQDALDDRLRERVSAALAAARTEAAPAAVDMFDDVLAMDAWTLEEQRQRMFGGEDN